MPEPKNLPVRFNRERIKETAQFTGESIVGMYKDPQIREAAKGYLRLLINCGITTADTIPGGIGEILSWGADALKGFHRTEMLFRYYRYNIEKRIRKYEAALVKIQEKASAHDQTKVADKIRFILNKLNQTRGKLNQSEAFLDKVKAIDPSKDVPLWAAGGSEVAEIPTGGALPTHAIETTWQGIKDFDGMKAGAMAFFHRLVAMFKGERVDFKQNQPAIAEAAGEFGVDFSNVEFVEYHDDDEGGNHE